MLCNRLTNFRPAGAPALVCFASLTAAGVLIIGLLGGCTDQHARDMAQEALDTAYDNTERLDRMYSKIMSNGDPAAYGEPESGSH